MIAEHALVALTADVPAERLLAGDVGVVLSVHKGGEAYTVEFMTVGGDTLAVLTLDASCLRPVSRDEMTQARPVAPVAA